jgi:hypothetical protein
MTEKQDSINFNKYKCTKKFNNIFTNILKATVAYAENCQPKSCLNYFSTFRYSNESGSSINVGVLLKIDSWNLSEVCNRKNNLNEFFLVEDFNNILNEQSSNLTPTFALHIKSLSFRFATLYFNFGENIEDLMLNSLIYSNFYYKTERIFLSSDKNFYESLMHLPERIYESECPSDSLMLFNDVCKNIVCTYDNSNKLLNVEKALKKIKDICIIDSPFLDELARHSSELSKRFVIDFITEVGSNLSSLSLFKFTKKQLKENITKIDSIFEVNNFYDGKLMLMDKELIDTYSSKFCPNSITTPSMFEFISENYIDYATYIERFLNHNTKYLGKLLTHYNVVISNNIVVYDTPSLKMYANITFFPGPEILRSWALSPKDERGKLIIDTFLGSGEKNEIIEKNNYSIKILTERSYFDTTIGKIIISFGTNPEALELFNLSCNEYFSLGNSKLMIITNSNYFKKSYKKIWDMDKFDKISNKTEWNIFKSKLFIKNIINKDIKIVLSKHLPNNIFIDFNTLCKEIVSNLDFKNLIKNSVDIKKKLPSILEKSLSAEFHNIKRRETRTLMAILMIKEIDNEFYLKRLVPILLRGGFEGMTIGGLLTHDVVLKIIKKDKTKSLPTNWILGFSVAELIKYSSIIANSETYELLTFLYEKINREVKITYTV